MAWVWFGIRWVGFDLLLWVRFVFDLLCMGGLGWLLAGFWLWFVGVLVVVYVVFCLSFSLLYVLLLL